MRSRAVQAGTLAAATVVVFAGLVAAGLHLTADADSSSTPTNEQSAVTREAAPKTRTLTGSVMVYAVFGDDADLCEYDPDPTGCLEDVLRQGSRLSNGEEFPEPDGPGGGYSDLHDGAKVVVRDQESTVLAVGELSQGTRTLDGVRFAVSVAQVPDSDFYEVAIGTQKPTVLSRAELDQAGWNFDLTIGS